MSAWTLDDLAQLIDHTNLHADATPDDMRKIAVQMDDSMGELMNMVVGMAVVIRVRPELADQEHMYSSYLRSGNDEEFNRDYNKAHDEYFARLHEAEMSGEA